MQVTHAAEVRPAPEADERVAKTSRVRRLLVRPEVGALAGAVAVWIFFAIAAGDRGFLSLRGTANYLEVAAQLGILAVAVALLSAELGWNVWLAMLASLGFALLLGVFNGYLVLRTELPSFIITLGTLLMVRGVTIGITRQLTGRTVVSGLDDVPGNNAIRTIFASDVTIAGAGFSIAIVWWLVIAAFATWVLL